MSSDSDSDSGRRSWTVESPGRFNLPEKFAYDPKKVAPRPARKGGASPKKRPTKSFRLKRYDTNHICTGAVSMRCSHIIYSSDDPESEGRRCKKCVVSGVVKARFCAQHAKYQAEHVGPSLTVRCHAIAASTGARCWRNALTPSAVGGPAAIGDAKCRTHGGPSVASPKRKK
jgi:hypothetical protein